MAIYYVGPKFSFATSFIDSFHLAALLRLMSELEFFFLNPGSYYCFLVHSKIFLSRQAARYYTGFAV